MGWVSLIGHRLHCFWCLLPSTERGRVGSATGGAARVGLLDADRCLLPSSERGRVGSAAGGAARVGLLDDDVNEPHLQPISIFNQSSCKAKKIIPRRLTSTERKSATLYVMLNCPKIEPFLNSFKTQFHENQVYASFATCFKNEVSQNTKQVYYVPYLLRNDKSDWWPVIKTKPIGRVEVENVLETAYQNEIQIDHQLVDGLNNPKNIFEEVNIVKEEAEWVGDEKTSEEGEWFRPNGGFGQKVRICITRHFNGYWTTWKKVPELDRDRMFEEFKRERQKKTEKATASQFKKLQQQLSSFIRTGGYSSMCPVDADDFSTDDDMKDEDEFDDEDF
ncbi:hypothetical protein FXO38_18077 [Capsicum annuum]|nr:hypothetical protein FXO38_18077 [Capsicum annuum]